MGLAASQTTYYEAKVTTFGCTSIDLVSQLQKVRSDAKAFQAALMEKQTYGECVAILKGTLVQGSIEATDDSILRVTRRSNRRGTKPRSGISRQNQWMEDGEASNRACCLWPRVAPAQRRLPRFSVQDRGRLKRPDTDKAVRERLVIPGFAGRQGPRSGAGRDGVSGHLDHHRVIDRDARANAAIFRFTNGFSASA